MSYRGYSQLVPRNVELPQFQATSNSARVKEFITAQKQYLLTYAKQGRIKHLQLAQHSETDLQHNAQYIVPSQTPASRWVGFSSPILKSRMSRVQYGNDEETTAIRKGFQKTSNGDQLLYSTGKKDDSKKVDGRASHSIKRKEINFEDGTLDGHDHATRLAERRKKRKLLKKIISPQSNQPGYKGHQRAKSKTERGTGSKKPLNKRLKLSSVNLDLTILQHMPAPNVGKRRLTLKPQSRPSIGVFNKGKASEPVCLGPSKKKLNTGTFSEVQFLKRKGRRESFKSAIRYSSSSNSTKNSRSEVVTSSRQIKRRKTFSRSSVIGRSSSKLSHNENDCRSQTWDIEFGKSLPSDDSTLENCDPGQNKNVREPNLANTVSSESDEGNNNGLNSDQRSISGQDVRYSNSIGTVDHAKLISSALPPIPVNNNYSDPVSNLYGVSEAVEEDLVSIFNGSPKLAFAYSYPQLFSANQNIDMDVSVTTSNILNECAPGSQPEFAQEEDTLLPNFVEPFCDDNGSPSNLFEQNYATSSDRFYGQPDEYFLDNDPVLASLVSSEFLSLNQTPFNLIGKKLRGHGSGDNTVLYHDSDTPEDKFSLNENGTFVMEGDGNSSMQDNDSSSENSGTSTSLSQYPTVSASPIYVTMDNLTEDRRLLPRHSSSSTGRYFADPSNGNTFTESIAWWNVHHWSPQKL